MKQAETDLTQSVNDYSGSTDGAQRVLGRAIMQARQNLRDAVARSNPQTAPIIQAANQGWAQLSQLETAAQSTGAMNAAGTVTPAQYSSAIRAGDNTVRNRATARGTALNQDLAVAGQQVLPNKYPDSGTAGRGGITALLAYLAGGGSLANPYTAPVGAAMMAYTPWGQRAATALLAQRPQIMQAAGNAVKQAVPYLPFPAVAGLLGNQ